MERFWRRVDERSLGGKRIATARNYWLLSYLLHDSVKRPVEKWRLKSNANLRTEFQTYLNKRNLEIETTFLSKKEFQGDLSTISRITNAPSEQDGITV